VQSPGPCAPIASPLRPYGKRWHGARLFRRLDTMGCGLGVPKKAAQYRTAAVSPSGDDGDSKYADAFLTEGHFQKLNSSSSVPEAGGAVSSRGPRPRDKPDRPSDSERQEGPAKSYRRHRPSDDVTEFPGPPSTATPQDLGQLRETANSEEEPASALPGALEQDPVLSGGPPPQPWCPSQAGNSPGIGTAEPTGLVTVDAEARLRPCPDIVFPSAVLAQEQHGEMRHEKEEEDEEEDEDEDEDEEDIALAARLALAALTPRSGRDSAATEGSAPWELDNAALQQAPKHVNLKCPVAPIGGPAALFPPDVDVSLPTRLLLLTWARWGRNSWRIQEEARIKKMQHIRYPKHRPLPPAPLSPQPTPHGTPRSKAAELTSPGQLTGAAQLRAGGAAGLAGTARSREAGAAKSGGGLFDEMIEEQRDCMQEQATRAKLTQKLGSGAALGFSTGTPGFGIETPSFPFGKSGSASYAASAEASAANSGVSSPVKGGQMSPWILEAEALVVEENDPLEGMGPSSAWGMGPSAESLMADLEAEWVEKPLPSTLRPAAGNSSSSAAEPLVPAADDDELQNVCMFADSPTKMLRGLNEQADASSDAKLEAQELKDPESGGKKLKGLTESTVEPPLSDLLQAGGYSAGEMVSYWSSSHNAWMPARIVERKSKSVYLIDKQLRGCLSKARASDLVSELEERRDPVLRAFAALESVGAPDSNRPQDQVQQKPQQQPKSLHVADASGTKSPFSSGSSTQASNGSRSPVAGPVRGRIVREDFSDDSDDDG